MFTIYVYTHFESEPIKKSVVDEELAIFYFKAFSAADDVAQVTMINGLTGEILHDYNTKEGWKIFNGQMIGW